MDTAPQERHLSPSVQVILAQLKKLGMTKTELAQRLGVSQDYVYRILNGRIAFPHARETLERMAGVCRVDPLIFAEYREVDQHLGASARRVWQRLRETGMSRDDLFQAMGGRISRPYFNSILRGDQPFPTNRAYIQLFALALALPPSAFVEFGPQAGPRWTDRDLAEMEERTYQLFFDLMMAAYGYTPHALTPTALDPARVLAFFQPRAAFAGELDRALTRMGELGMGFRELEKVSGVEAAELRALFAGEAKPKKQAALLAQILRSLHIG
ncbi:MAG: helix-turn-helix domain-containing protein [Candidatus Sericytochromatia bacterium]